MQYYIIDKIHLYDKIYAGCKMYYERDDRDRYGIFKMIIFKAPELKVRY